MPKHSEQSDLSPAQSDLMQLIWRHGPVSATDLVRLVAKERVVARNTIRTLLERMEEKGWITHQVEGRRFLYTAAQPKQKTIGRKIRDLIETLCAGSPETMMTALLNERGLTAHELERIRELLDLAQATQQRKRGTK